MHIGLIGNVALTASFGGSRVLGIVLTAIKQFLGGSVSSDIEVPSILERVPKMLEYSDAFIALSGGLGTCADILHIAYWLTLTIHSKPIGLLNVNGFYDGLLTFLDHAVQQGFMSETSRQVIISDSDPERLIEKLQVFEFKYDKVASQLDWFGDGGKKKNDDLDLRLSL